jgi:triphosphatase
MSTEVESKYLLPDAATMRDILAVRELAGYDVRPLGKIKVVDRYLDTPDRTLLRQGWACRLRRQGDTWVAGLKTNQQTQGAIVSRAEFEVTLPTREMAPYYWPESEARTRLLQLTNGQELERLVKLRQVRHRAMLLREGCPVAQLSLDRVDVVGLGKRYRRYMLECELEEGGDPADLERVDAYLSQHYPLTPEPRAKLQLALELLGLPLASQMTDGGPGTQTQAALVSDKTETLGIRASDTVAVAAHKILHFYLERMLAHEEGTRLGQDPEELHDMRVAIRRIRSALRLLGPYLDMPLLGECQEQLREAARILGEVRDMDVALARARDYLAGLPAEEQHDLDPLLEMWQTRRRERFQYMNDYLRSIAYVGLVQALRSMVTTLGTAGDQAGEAPAISQVAPQHIYLGWQFVRAYNRVVSQAPLEIWHALRIDCKRLRYAMEDFKEILPARVKTVIPQITAMQDHLGELRDAQLAIVRVDEYLLGRPDKNKLQQIIAYRESERARLCELQEGFPKVWERFSRSRLKRRMSAMLARP